MTVYAPSFPQLTGLYLGGTSFHVTGRNSDVYQILFRWPGKGCLGMITSCLWLFQQQPQQLLSLLPNDGHHGDSLKRIHRRRWKIERDLSATWCAPLLRCDFTDCKDGLGYFDLDLSGTSARSTYWWRISWIIA